MMTFSDFQRQFHIEANPQQAAAIQKVDGPVLLLAVPGSGKTTVLVARLGYMIIACGVRPETILTMTYTEAAAREMRARFALLFGDALTRRMQFRTINSVSLGIINYYERAMGTTAFTLLGDEGKKAAILREICSTQSREYAADSVVKSVSTAITYAKNNMLRDDELEEIELEEVDFPGVYQTYGCVLRERRLMDYDDQLVYAYQILRRYPTILRAFRNRYRYLCVDEAQDTSKIQHAIIRLLAEERRNLFMVGDEDQSIYGFRAAYPQALMEFERQWPDAAVLLMEKNYRSTPQIVAAADRFIRANANRHPKSMTADRADGAALRQITVTNRMAQYRYLVKTARDCREETAVLYRDNDSALPLIDLLCRENIPYRCRQLDAGFFTNRIVSDVSDIIRLSANPTDGEVFLRIYYKLGARISKEAALRASRRSQLSGRPILTCLADAPETTAWLRKKCGELQTHLEHMRRESGDRAVYRIVQCMGYGAYLSSRGSDANKAAILEAIGASEPTPMRLLERLEMLRGLVKDGSQAPAAKFILSTIHSSKGLEYDRVFLMDVADGILPAKIPPRDGTAKPSEQEAYEEERRVFYVGMTRAKNELSIFRFQDAGLYSTFAELVFPTRRTTLQTAGAKPFAVCDRAAPASVQVIAKDYVPGVRVRHSLFGAGVMTARDDDIVRVRFDDGTERRFSLFAALGKGLFSRLS